MNKVSAEAGRRLELDGLRGVAILLVVFAHAVQGVSPSYRGLNAAMGSLGGFVGVQLFLVLSGFLITRILVAERVRTGAISLDGFYRRRFRRLAPSLLVVSAVVLVVDPVSVLRAVTYTANLAGGPHGDGTMGHAWSLAVEEQFYLAWPLLLVVFRSHAVAVASAGIVVTLVAQQTVGWSDSAVYAGLRWDALLAGCLLALVPVKARAWWFPAGACVIAAYTLGMFGDHVERIDYPIATLACVAVVAGASKVRSLRVGWLRHVGAISYALYLWHVLVMRVDLPTPVTLAASLVLAEVTWLAVDRRAQRQPATTSIDAFPRVGPVQIAAVPASHLNANL